MPPVPPVAVRVALPHEVPPPDTVTVEGSGFTFTVEVVWQVVPNV